MKTINIPNAASVWLQKGEKGISSEVIFGAISGLWLSNWRMTPSDPDDFRRCYLLIKQVPEWKKELWRVAEISSAWENVVENWDKLCEMLEDQLNREKEGRSKANGMYEFMKSLGC